MLCRAQPEWQSDGGYLTTVAGQAGTGRGVDGGVGGGWGGSEKKSICLDFVLLKKKNWCGLFFFCLPGFLLLLEK